MGIDVQAAYLAAISQAWLQTIGRMHVAIVHFPIALLLLAGVIEFGRAILRKNRPSATAVACLVLGAISAIAAAAMGCIHREFGSYGGDLATVLTYHLRIGIASAAVAVAALIPLLLHREMRRWPLRLYRWGAIACAILVAVAGHLGGTLTHGPRYLTELIWQAAPDAPQGLVKATPTSLVNTDISKVHFPANGKIDFIRDVQPILAHSCYECHGAAKRRGSLRLDNKAIAFKGGNSGPAIIAGNSEKSPLIRRVLGLDHQKRMPVGRPALPDEHIKILKAWIEQGAHWPDAASIEGGREEQHWAYVKPVRPELPQVKDTAWCRNGIDYFVLSKLEKEHLRPSPEADRPTLIRRVSLDLTGIPPTPEEVDAFVNDASPDAYERLVNRLLSSPHYGERWGRHWLDLARYADTNGYEKDNPRIIWPYRDWVINALNRDTTFDQFVIQQIAGDMLPNATPEDIIATGFHRNTMFNEEGGIDAEEFRFKAIVDRVQTTSTAFLGLTMQCAQCHNHKYDAISQKEYYEFFAFFNNADEPQYKIPSNEIAEKRSAIDAQIAAIEADLPKQFPTHEDKLVYATTRPSKLTAASGATFSAQEDGSYLVGGNAVPQTESYVLEIPADFKDLVGVKIEALTDKSLTKNGPGRKGAKGNGNFAITELKASAAPAATQQVIPIALVSPLADFGQAGWEADKAIDGNPATGWACDDASGTNKSRFATFRFKDKLPDGPGTITLTIDQSHPEHALGRFRISLARNIPPAPTTRPVEEQRAEFLAEKMRQWEEQVRPKCAHWTVLDPVKFSREHEATITKLPDKSLLFTGDLYYRDQYQLAFDVADRGITGIRLEVLPHDDLPRGGPGRDDNGSFLLSEITATALPMCKANDPDATPRPVILQNPSADASNDTVARAIDGKKDSHWTIGPGKARARTAVFQVKDGYKVGGDCGTRLSINLDTNYFSAKSLGRVRISITTDEKPVEASGLPGDVEQIILAPADQRTADQQARLQRQFLLTTPLLAEQQRQIAALEASKPDFQTTLVMKERKVPRTTRLHHRGEYLQPREVIDHAAVPAILPQLPPGAPADRLTLARWLVSGDNPLIARVTVNRIWSRYFGRGIVNTVEDFGVMGEKPTHPRLLDWLATEFVRNNWSLKSLHRLVVTSATYRQASQVSPDMLKRDPQNLLLARGPRVRVEAETVRDIALAASGLLNGKIGGPSVFPPQPAGVSDLSYGPLAWKTSEGPDRYRRGLYTYIKRTSMYPGLTTFDAPTSEVVCPRRARSNSPLQALTTLNDEVFVEAAQAMARRVVSEAPDFDARLNRVFRLCVARQPDTVEEAKIKAFYEKQLARFRDEKDKAGDAARVAALDPAKAQRFAQDAGVDVPELAAWTIVSRAVLNLDETITKE